MTRKKYPFESDGIWTDGPMLWRNITGKGMVIKEGTLLSMRRFELDRGRSPTGGQLVIMGVASTYFELRFSENPDEVQGYIHTGKTINRIKNKERIGIQVDPITLWVRKAWPLDRQLKWYQF